MVTSLTWTDDFGFAELTNGMPEPGDRFSGWTHLTTEAKGGARVSAVALGTGLTYTWDHRVDYGAKFSLAYIANADQVLCARLKLHLEGGGTVTVNTGDSDDNSYDCTIWPGSEVSLGPPDKKDLKLTVSLSVRNTAADFMLCTYP